VGPIKNGGIATADTALAEALTADGHQVTVLYMHGAGVQIKTIEV
jgi:glycogen synthase